MPERFRVVCTIKALYKCSDLPLPLPFTCTYVQTRSKLWPYHDHAVCSNKSPEILIQSLLKSWQRSWVYQISKQYKHNQQRQILQKINPFSPITFTSEYWQQVFCSFLS